MKNNTNHDEHNFSGKAMTGGRGMTLFCPKSIIKESSYRLSVCDNYRLMSNYDGMTVSRVYARETILCRAMQKRFHMQFVIYPSYHHININILIKTKACGYDDDFMMLSKKKPSYKTTKEIKP